MYAATRRAARASPSTFFQPPNAIYKTQRPECQAPFFSGLFLRLLGPHIEAMHLPGVLRRYPRSNVPKILLLQIVFWSLMSSAVSETCYWPNGDTAKLYVACPDSKVCCLTGEACLSNGMCYGTKLNIAYRGACSDKSWPIAERPRVCYTGRQRFLTYLQSFDGRKY